MPALLVRPTLQPYRVKPRIKPINQAITPDQVIAMNQVIAPDQAMETKNSKVENAYAVRCIYSRNAPT